MSSCNCQDRVNKFTQAVGTEIPEKPKLMTREDVLFAIRMVMSEMHELANTVTKNSEEGLELMHESLKTLDHAKHDGPMSEIETIAEQSDAMVDAYYYMLNVAGRNGHNLSRVFDVVHGANMAKIDPVTGKCHRRESDGKILKPEGWKAPDIVGVIKEMMKDEEPSRSPKEDDITVMVRVEVPLGATVKYEYHDGELYCDRVLHTPFAYPFNYGFIPDTLGEDNDELDAVVLTDFAMVPGTLIKCRILGALLMEDEAGLDTKIILVPVDKVDPSHKEIQELNDLSTAKLDKIDFFFRHYKRLEPEKWVKILNFITKVEAIEKYHDSIERYDMTVPSVFSGAMSQ